MRLVRPRDTLFLMDSDAAYTVHINEATMFVPQVKINRSILTPLVHKKMLSKVTTNYPPTRVEIKNVTSNCSVHREFIDKVIRCQLERQRKKDKE